MPLSELHKKKKYKNLAVLAVILIVVLLFFGVTLVKFHAS